MERDIAVSVHTITRHPDLALIDRMKRRCPALAILLPVEDQQAEALDTLSEEERNVLRALSAEVLLSPLENVEETIAVLNRLAIVGDASVLPLVQRLVAMPVRLTIRTQMRPLAEFGHDSARIQQAARMDIQERILLRGSHAPNTPDMLLRPVEASPREQAPDQLLRGV